MTDDITPEAETPAPKPSAPKARKIAKDSVVGNGDTDAVLYSKARIPGPTEGRKSLTVLHVQRALTARGFAEAQSAPGGRFEALTTRAVQAYQRSRDEEPTGVLTREQFADLFEGDPNVSVSVDTPGDHAV